LRIVLLGPPGAGKGTQAALLKEKFGIPHISTGEIFREEIEKGSALGIRIREFVSKGILVPDEIVVEVVKNRLSASDCINGWILDGFPRTLNQAKLLDKILQNMEQKIDIAIYIDVPEEEAIRRLLSRGRGDDKICTLKRRFKEYLNKTAPVIEYYKEKGLLVMINGVGSIEEVHLRILNALKEKRIIN